MQMASKENEVEPHTNSIGEVVCLEKNKNGSP